MAIDFDVKAQARADEGKGASRRLRHNNLVPAVVYGGDKDPQSITLKFNEITKHLEHEAFYSHILNVDIDGDVQKAVLRDVQRHPARNDVMHVDFQRVSDDDVIRLLVPLHFVNEAKSPAIKLGARVRHNMSTVEVLCAVKDLPEFIEVDLAAAEGGQIIHLSDLVLPEGVRVAALEQGAQFDLPVVTLSMAKR